MNSMYTVARRTTMLVSVFAASLLGACVASDSPAFLPHSRYREPTPEGAVVIGNAELRRTGSLHLGFALRHARPGLLKYERDSMPLLAINGAEGVDVMYLQHLHVYRVDRVTYVPRHRARNGVASLRVTLR